MGLCDGAAPAERRGAGSRLSCKTSILRENKQQRLLTPTRGLGNLLFVQANRARGSRHSPMPAQILMKWRASHGEARHFIRIWDDSCLTRMLWLIVVLESEAAIPGLC